MATARIVMPDGLSVDIDGTPEEVTAVVQKLRADRQWSRSAGAGSSASDQRGEIPGLIAQLKSEEFFKTPRGLSELQKKLAESGHHYPLTTLSGAVQSQTKKRNLRRFKQGGKYVYVQ